MNDEETLSVIDHLITTAEDGKSGFTEAAKTATDARLKDLFSVCAEDCAEAVAELRNLAVEHGGEPDTSGSVAAKAHRGWMKAKSGLEDKNLAVLEEVERGQDYAKAAYTKALKRELPIDVHTVIRRQASGAVKNHDLIRDLRNGYKTAHSRAA